MSVGFVMLAHAALHRATQVALSLSKAGCPVVIHVDKRVDMARFQAFAESLSAAENIHLAPRVACDWGTWSLVAASRDGAKFLLDHYPHLGHVALISGACMPIKPVESFVAYLSQHADTDFIESVTIRDVPWAKGGLSDERFTLSFPFAWKRQKKLFDAWVGLQRKLGRHRRMPVDLQPHMGSQWWCLSRGTLERILTDSRRPELDRYFKKVWIRDESYFQSLVRLYGTHVESRSLTMTKFDFQGKPHVFYDDHLRLLKQSPAFFARKIWPGAHLLYKAFLDGGVVKEDRAVTASVSHIARTFDQAVAKRTRGRGGLVMASRFPDMGYENGLTAAPYAVFQGFGDVLDGFPNWISRVTGSHVHGHLFARDKVEFVGDATGYAGAISDSALLRDYDPEAFLRNLIWNTRGHHQSFLYSPRDAAGPCEFLCRDRNAFVAAISGAWAVPLLRSGRSQNEVRAEAARLQQIEAAFLDRLRDRHTSAKVRIWTLAEFLERPLDALQEVVDELSGADTQVLEGIPAITGMEGLPDFLQALRNAGMNPYLAGDISELPKPEPLSPLERIARLN